MLYRLAAVTLACSLLISCNEETAFSDFTPTTTTTTTSGGGGGGDGGTSTGTGTGGGGTTVGSIVRKTQIPVGFSFGGEFDMGNSDDSISYVLDSRRLFRPDDVSGQVELYTRLPSGSIETTTAGDGNKILSHTGVRDVIDYSDGNTVTIGTALSQNVKTISDAGDVVAFASNADLTGANPSGVNQIFTLSTDGADTYNQITTFTINHMLASVVISGDGRRIFFSSDDDVLLDGSNSDGSYEVFSVNADSTGLAQLSNINAGTITVTRSSTDGSILALEIINLIGGGLKWLEAFNTATGTLTEIAVTPGSTIDYDMSADGSRATYLGAGAVVGVVVHVVNTSSGTRTEVLEEPGSVSGLQMNTDGSQISFASSTAFDTPIGPDELSTQVYTMTLR